MSIIIVAFLPTIFTTGKLYPIITIKYFLFFTHGKQTNTQTKHDEQHKDRRMKCVNHNTLFIAGLFNTLNL